MIFANNAVFCPDSTAIDAAEIDGSTFSYNYLAGKLTGATLDGSVFLDGGMIESAFVEPAEHNYWPGPASMLIGNADPDYVPELDYNQTIRKPPFEVGAYEWEFTLENPGRRIKEGFKMSE